MTKSQFQELSIHDKGTIVFTDGKPISFREYYNQKIDRYALYGFFVEVYYNCRRSRISKIQILKTTNIAKPGLDK